MEEMQDDNGACSISKIENRLDDNGTVSPGILETCDILDNETEDRKKKHKTRRHSRGKKSKSKKSDGSVSSEQQKAEAMTTLENLTQNHSEMLLMLGSGIRLDINSDDAYNHSQTVLTSGPSTLQKNKPEKKKNSKKKHVPLSPVHSMNNETGIPNRLQAQANEMSKSVNSPNRNCNRNKGHSNSESEPKEKTSFEDYMLMTEAMAALQNKKLISGVVRINQRCYKEAYINSPDKGQDILIQGMRNRNRALEGDEVLVKLNPESEWKDNGLHKQRTGKVVFIKEKFHSRLSTGFLKLMQDKNKDWAIFSPRDSRIPRIKIPMKKCPEDFLQNADNYKETLMLVKLEEWEDVRYALGSIVEIIGDIRELKTEAVAVLLENDIEVSPFDTHLYQYFPRSPFILPEKEIDSRTDLRNQCIFTIDPLTARDLDDAVSCKELENGNLLVGVHIADVSYFLKEGTPLDLAVSRRATSTYLVESVQHMLPRELCMLCSLFPGEDKLAFSVFWEITKEAEIVTHYFTRSVINSCVQLTYEHAQEMLENPTKDWTENELPPIHGNYKPSDLSCIVNNLNRIAVILRENRFKDGALRIDQPKITFTLERGTGNPLSYTLHENKDSNRLIEEFMLLANMTVASRLNADFPDIAFLRCHPSPHQYVMEQLQKSMEQIGIFLNVESAGGLQASLWRYAGSDFESQARMMVLNNLCAKPMARAKYFCASAMENEEEFCHYALNVALYTHFTSPIRRYADIIVHRLLCASLGYNPKPDWQPDSVQKIAVNCNKQKYMAKRAGEQSTELYLAAYIELHEPMVEEAVVMDVKDFSIDIIICSMGLNQRVYTNKCSVPTKVYCKEDEKKKIIAQEIKWLPTDEIPYMTTQVVNIFSIVTVEVTRSKATRKIESRLLRPTS